MFEIQIICTLGFDVDIKTTKYEKKKKKIQNTPKKNELCFWLNFGGYLVV